jgi:hypothetical protein
VRLASVHDRTATPRQISERSCLMLLGPCDRSSCVSMLFGFLAKARFINCLQAIVATKLHDCRRIRVRLTFVWSQQMYPTYETESKSSSNKSRAGIWDF